MAKRQSPISDDLSARTNKIVIPLNQDNSIDWDSVRSSQKAQLLQTVNDDVTILEHIGMAHESGGGGEGEVSDFEGDITQANVAAFLDGLTKTNAIAVSMLIPRFMQHPFLRTRDGKRVPFTIDKDIALKNFSLTAEQHKELDPRAERLARKYMPAAAKKHLDVIMLVSMYFTYMTQNLQLTIQAQMQKDLVKFKDGQQAAPPQAPIESDNIKPNGHAPEPEPEPNEPGGESLEPGNEPPLV